jgi:hypothetical protein
MDVKRQVCDRNVNETVNEIELYKEIKIWGSL